MHIKKIAIGIVFVVVLVGVFAYLQRSTFQQNEKPKTVEKITISRYELPTLALLFIAEQNGYFKDENLDVVYRKFPSGKDALADVLAGNADIATVYETPVVRQIYGGKDVSIISTLHTSSKFMALVGMRNKGINSIEDIRGKKIGVFKGTSHEFFLTSYLTSQGIKLSDVTLVHTEYTNSINSLRNGSIDAVVVENPYFYELKKEFPADKIIIFQSDVYTTNSVLAGDTSVIKTKKEALTRLLRALVRAEDLLKNNKEEAIKSVIKSVPEFSEESIRGTWDQFTPTVSLNNILLSIMNREAQWFKDNAVFERPIPDFRKSLFIEYLKEVRPDAVTVY